jgi:hypothetical protein
MDRRSGSSACFGSPSPIHSPQKSKQSLEMEGHIKPDFLCVLYDIGISMLDFVSISAKQAEISNNLMILK